MAAETNIVAGLGSRRPLWTLLTYRLLAARNQLQSVREESRLKLVVVTVLGLAFWTGLFLLFLHGFEFININAGPPRVRAMLVHHILALFFVAVLLMLTFSNAVISFQSLFRAPETAFLFSLPLRRDTIFIYKLVESLVFSSWAVFAAGLPLLLAWGIRFSADWYFYPMMAVFLVPFVLLPAGIGSLLALVVTRIVPRHGRKVLGLLAFVVMAVGLYLVVTLLSVPSSRYTFGMDAGVGAILSRLSFTQHFMAPSFWITEGLLGVGENGTEAFGNSACFLAALISTAAFAMSLGWFVAGPLYPGAYSLASSAQQTRRKLERTFLEQLLSPLQRRYPQIVILVIKDLKTFLRDPAQWSQVLIFFGILALYIGNLRNFAYPVDDIFYHHVISFLNLGATCMTLATMTSRFVFPLISLEGCRFWVLGLVPLARRDLLLSKFYFALAGSLMLTTSLVLLSNYILGTAGFILVIQLITGVLVSVGLSGLSVGMGALFPSFQERNPSKIVSGFGGTLTLILAISLVIFTIAGEGLVCHWSLVPQLATATLGPEYDVSPVIAAVLLGMAAANGLAAYIPMKLGVRALERVEF